MRPLSRRQIIGALLLGTTIGNYQITALLGEGGMGKVYVARHPTLARKSAIKVLHADQAHDPVALSRFFTEARAADAIRHPSIVEIYDYGTLPDGAPYIVMEYLEGETLASRLERGPLSMSESLDILCQTASALAAAHAKDVLHRDLKPDNLFLLTESDERPRVKIVDFGIAKLQNDLTEISHRTRTGALVGTPLYMSPEQCLGAKDVGTASDLYALAVIAYQLLCGRPPFEAEAVGALINMHVNEPVLAPRKLNPKLPRPLEELLLSGLAKMPEDRPAGMEAFLAALEKVRVQVDGSPELAATMPPLRAALSTDTPLTVGRPAESGSLRTHGTPGAGRRRWTVVAGLAVAGIVAGLIGLVERGHRAPATTVQLTGKTAAPPVVAPPVEPPVAAPLAVSMQLDSDPPGATVSVGGKEVGTTPTTVAVVPGPSAIELVFSLDGYHREVIQALPSEGLRLRAHLEPLKRSTGKKPRLAARPSPVDDIKSER